MRGIGWRGREWYIAGGGEGEGEGEEDRVSAHKADNNYHETITMLSSPPSPSLLPS